MTVPTKNDPLCKLSNTLKAKLADTIRLTAIALSDLRNREVILRT